MLSSIPSHGLLSNDEMENTEDKIGQRYVDLWRGIKEEIRALLENEAWFA